MAAPRTWRTAGHAASRHAGLGRALRVEVLGALSIMAITGLGCALVWEVLSGAEPSESGRRTSGELSEEPDAVTLREVYADTPLTRAVDRGLEYLAGEQLDDGSWLSRGEDLKSGYGKNAGITGLALLALLARGHEPGRGPYGTVIDRGIAWLLANQSQGMVAGDPQSRSHGPMYSHGIATLVLGEVLGMADDETPGLERLYRVHRVATNLVLRAQSVPKNRFDFGGWRYHPDSTDSDLSVTGWQLLALRGARDAGLPVPQKSIDQAVRYVIRCAHPGGGFGYQPGEEPTIAMTGTGILALQICGEHESEEARKGGDWMLRHSLEWRGPFFHYSAYYGSQAMYQLGGDYWRRWQPIVQKILLEKQRADGSWPVPPGGVHESQAGPIYATALAVLSLGVEFHYLPIYQR